jgi:glutaredoxin
MYEVYGTKGCGFCIQATKVLDRLDADYTYTDLSVLTDHDKARLQEIAGKTFRTVPQIFKIEGNVMKHIGGYTELMESLND